MKTRVLVKQTPPHTVHRLDCAWVAGTTYPPDRYREMDARDVQPGWKRCRKCAPDVGVAATGGLRGRYAGTGLSAALLADRGEEPG